MWKKIQVIARQKEVINKLEIVNTKCPTTCTHFTVSISVSYHLNSLHTIYSSNNTHKQLNYKDNDITKNL